MDNLLSTGPAPWKIEGNKKTVKQQAQPVKFEEKTLAYCIPFITAYT